VVKRGKQSVALRGRIDRVDVAHTDHGAAFAVVDYKTGAAPSTKSMREGTALQLPLYAMAAHQLLPGTTDAVPAALRYWVVGGKGTVRTLKAATPESSGWAETSDWTDARDAAVGAVVVATDAMRHGTFPVCPPAECPSYCDYRTICRAGEVQALGKAWPGSGHDDG